eukprot:1161070-Pelagomonas_calceolata.AAC.9
MACTITAQGVIRAAPQACGQQLHLRFSLKLTVLNSACCCRSGTPVFQLSSCSLSRCWIRPFSLPAVLLSVWTCKGGHVLCGGGDSRLF